MPIPTATLLQRADFLRLKADGKRVHKDVFVLQYLPATNTTLTVGYTTSSRAIGNAVKRNRGRRRLRAAVATLAKTHSLSGGGAEIALIARLPVLTQPFELLLADLTAALTTAGIIQS